MGNSILTGASRRDHDVQLEEDMAKIPHYAGIVEKLLSTVELDMVPKHTPETPGDIQARLDHLRNRKAVLDELILCLERYSMYEIPKPRKEAAQHSEAGEGIPTARLAGAA